MLFYDIEVFAYDNLIVVKDLNHNVVHKSWNNHMGLREVLKSDEVAGYNNYYYDDIVATCMLKGMTVQEIKRVNDLLVHNQKVAIKVDPVINSIDCFQQIDVSNPSLKRIEANMGMMIKESDVPFDIDRPLTEEERKDVEFYCEYDVDATIEVYKEREHSYFESKKRILDMLGNPKAKKWNTTTISGNLLLKKPMPKWATPRVPEWCFNDPDLPEPVREMWKQFYDPASLRKDWKPKVKSYTFEMFDNEITFGIGGGHSVNTKERYFENVKLLDVTSMYPSIIILLKILGEATPKYKAIYDQRVAVKHTDTGLSNALKLILNSVYGNLGNAFSILYNPQAARTVCIYGMISLFKLAKMLYDCGCTIVQINTDGVAFVDNGCEYEHVWHEWEKTFGLGLEEDLFSKWWQKDVNNYIAVKPNGKIKVKGGDVRKYGKDYFFQNNSCRIISMAVVEKIVNGKDPAMTLYENMDKPYLYQYVLQAGKTYQGVVDSDGNFQQYVNRAFATRGHGVKLYKKRQDGGLVTFPNSPDNMKIWNDDCEKIEDFHKWVDLNHYFQEVKTVLNRWI